MHQCSSPTIVELQMSMGSRFMKLWVSCVDTDHWRSWLAFAVVNLEKVLRQRVGKRIWLVSKPAVSVTDSSHFSSQILRRTMPRQRQTHLEVSQTMALSFQIKLHKPKPFLKSTQMGQSLFAYLQSEWHGLKGKRDEKEKKQANFSSPKELVFQQSHMEWLPNASARWNSCCKVTVVIC